MTPNCFTCKHGNLTATQIAKMKMSKDPNLKVQFSCALLKDDPDYSSLETKYEYLARECLQYEKDE